MDPALKIEKVALARQKGLSEVIGKFDSPTQQFYDGTSVFVTGGTGFIGKQIIEKLCRSTKIKRLYILIRRKKGVSVGERIHATLKDPIFDLLHEKQPSFVDVLVPIEGDITALGLGLDEVDKHTILTEVNVIFHIAATTNFGEPMKSATLTNVRGTREVLNLAQQCSHLKTILYISTAYSNANTGTIGKAIGEQFYPCPMPPESMIKLAEEMDEERLTRMTPGLTADWANSYAFTKALAENLIRDNSGDLPISILRPSIVIGANLEPIPGWIDFSSALGPSGYLLGPSLGVTHIQHINKYARLDLIPSDYVANAAIVAAATKERLKIYNIASSNRNPITYAKVIHIWNTKLLKLLSPKIMWYCSCTYTSHLWLYHVAAFVLHKIPAYLVDGLSVVMNKPPRLRKIYTTLDKFSSIGRFITYNDWVFDDSNTLELYRNLSEDDKIIYKCDVTDINWNEQVLLWFIGLRKYIVKDGLSNTDYAMRKQFCLKIATYILCAKGFFIIWKLIFYLNRVRKWSKKFLC